MKIHEVETQLGVTKQALIYYEKEGLITPVRDDNNYRHYTQNDIDILQVILFLRSLEISIDEIRLILSGELSIRRCLDNKQKNIKQQKDKIARIEKQIKECIQRTKVILEKEISESHKTENSYVKLSYSKERIVYGDNIVLAHDINSIDISLCCSKVENNKYYMIHNLYFIYVDINTCYDTYSIQIMNNNEVHHFFEYLKNLPVVLNDPLGLIQLFEEEKDDMVIYKYFNQNFPKWKKEHNLEMILFNYTFIEDNYIKPLQELKKEGVPSIKDQLKQLLSGYKDIFRKKGDE